MPKKVPSLVTHVAHLVGAMFECPNCEQVAVYSEKEVSLYGMTCNKCLQPFNIAISERLLEFCKPCQQKVRQDEQNEFEIEPWLRGPVEAEQIKKLQHLMFQQAFAHCFIDHGCFKCETKTYPHAGSSLCKRCKELFQNRMKPYRKRLGAT